MTMLQARRKAIYVGLVALLLIFLLLDYVPGLSAYAAWVTPPVALFLGLAFALVCGQAHPRFNKKAILRGRAWLRHEPARLAGFGP